MCRWISLRQQYRNDPVVGGRAEAGDTHRSDTSAQVYASLLKFVYSRVPCRDDAQDIVQDAFARFLVARRREEIRNPAAYLKTSALNALRDRARAAAVRRTVHQESGWDRVQCDAPSAERVVEGREELAVLSAAMAELAPKRRAALILHRLEGHSQRNVAAELGLSLSMVEKHIRHGLEHCRRRVGEAKGQSRGAGEADRQSMR